MYLIKKIPLLLIMISWLCIGQSCVQKKPSLSQDLPKGKLLISPDFTSQSLNDLVWVNTKFTEADLNRNDLKKRFVENATKVKQRKESILLGHFSKYPRAWFYTQIINTTNENQALVADEFNRLRCDMFELYTIEDDGIKKWGSLNRSTPFSKYPLPFLTYALPFTIQAKDTLNLVIHTERHFGVHEVNLNISRYDTYLSTNFSIFITRIFQVTFFMILAITMLILGQIFHYKSITYWGLNILGIVFVYITTWGFIDPFINFPYIGLSGSNVSVFGMMVAITPPLFSIEWMKPIPKNEKVFKTIIYSLFGISLFFTVCYLFPKPLFNHIQNTVNLSLMMIILTLLNLAHFIYCSLLALIRAKVYYLFIGLLISYAPFILSQIPVFSQNSILLFKSDNVILFFTSLGTALVCIFLLREQLVTRRKLEENLFELKETLEDIRKNEVEVIGRNLHDNVGNILASAMSYLNLKSPNTEISENLIKEAIQEIRFVSHNLVKDEDTPLLQKLESLVYRFNDFSVIRFVFENFAEHRINQLDKTTQQNIYMITQEVLTNIIKHSKATEAYVQIFERENNTIQPTIEDDGIGILNFTENGGIGLKNIYKRAKISNLKLTVDSTPAGTNFIIETPNTL